MPEVEHCYALHAVIFKNTTRKNPYDMKTAGYQLTSRDREFIKRHEIPYSKIFNARQVATGDLKKGMKIASAWIAVNARPCTSSGHTIRTNGGHCAECDTSRISFAKRHTSAGYVYVATSKRAKLVKVGMTINIQQRENLLNGYAYGEQRDWRIVSTRKCSNAGKSEFQVHKLLSKHEACGTYYKGGEWLDCYELFSCSETVAIEALQSIETDE